MLRLESQLTHEEFKFKSELQIKNWRKRSSVEKKQATLAISQGLQNFAAPTKFRRAGRIWLLLLTFFALFQIWPYVIVFLF